MNTITNFIFLWFVIQSISYPFDPMSQVHKFRCIEKINAYISCLGNYLDFSGASDMKGYSTYGVFGKIQFSLIWVQTRWMQFDWSNEMWHVKTDVYCSCLDQLSKGWLQSTLYRRELGLYMAMGSRSPIFRKNFPKRDE